MPSLTPQQKNKLQKLAKVVDKGSIAVVEHLFSVEEKIDGLENKIPDLEKVITAIKGKDGKNGENGKDGKGTSGRDGENGKDYILTEKDKKEIAKSISIPVVKQIVETKTIIREQPIVRETIVKEAIPLHTSPEEVRDLLELLFEDERLDAKSIKNLEIAFKAYLQLNPPNGPMLHPVSLGNLPDVNIAGAIVGQVLTWNGVYWDAENGGGGGSGVSVLRPTSGTVNDTNTTFVFAQIPSSIVINGQEWLPSSTSGGIVVWTNVGTTVTLANPVGTGGDIYGFISTSSLTLEMFGVTVDGNGSLITTGSKGFRQIPFNCTITSWTVLNDQSGSVAFDIKKSTYSGFPTDSSIVASAPPTTSSTQKNTSSTLTGWTTTLLAGDILEFIVTGSPISVTRTTLSLNVTVS